MYDVIVHDDIFCTKEKRRQLHSTKSNMTTHLPPICPYTPPLPRPGASKYRTKPFALHYSIQTTGTTARHLTGARATSPGTAGRRATFPSTAMLQYERVDDGDGCVVVVECIAVAVASLCGFAGAEASPARRRAYEIVEMMRRRQRRGSTVGRTGPKQRRQR